MRIVYRDERLAVVDKPSGLLSAPGRGAHKSDSVASRIRAQFPDADGPLTVHRLDMDTSGLIVVGLTRDAHRSLSKQFEQRKIGKTYIAVLDGLIENDEGAIDLPLMVDWPNRPRQKIDHTEGKPAQTLYRVIERDESTRTTRVEFRPMTGRSHQLRMHAASPEGLNASILGDSLYGGPTKAPRLLLHANMLAFFNPGGGGDWMKFESPPPF